MGSSGQHLGGRAGEALTDRCIAQLAAVQAARTYFVAHGLLASGRALEAFALFGRSLDRIGEAKKALNELSSPPPPPRSSPTPSATLGASSKSDVSGADDLIGLDQFIQLATSYRAVAHAESCCEVLKGQEALDQGLGNVSISAEPASHEASYLMDRLDAWESFAGQPAANQAPARPPRVFQIPYAMQPLAMRPIMLDTANSYVQYPDLSKRFKKSENKAGAAAGSSMLSSLFGWGKK